MVNLRFISDGYGINTTSNVYVKDLHDKEKVKVLHDKSVEGALLNTKLQGGEVVAMYDEKIEDELTVTIKTNIIFKK
ncbi:hypothetical protein [Clostridium baratii]|uniref:hypothetical protein n=1 Tax=Clostridium baratii TaxID=1561 RepID=UPI003D33B2C5